MASRNADYRVRQRDLMVFAMLKQALSRRGYVPSYRELADRLPASYRGTKISISQVSSSIQRLEEWYKVIKREPNKARAIGLSDVGHQVWVLPLLEPGKPPPKQARPVQRRAKAKPTRKRADWWYTTIDQAFVTELDIQPSTLQVVRQAGVQLVTEAKILLATTEAELPPKVSADLHQALEQFEQLKVAS